MTDFLDDYMNTPAYQGLDPRNTTMAVYRTAKMDSGAAGFLDNVTAILEQLIGGQGLHLMHDVGHAPTTSESWNPFAEAKSGSAVEKLANLLASVGIRHETGVSAADRAKALTSQFRMLVILPRTIDIKLIVTGKVVYVGDDEAADATKVGSWELTLRQIEAGSTGTWNGSVLDYGAFQTAIKAVGTACRALAQKHGLVKKTGSFDIESGEEA